jgi:signal peptidase I
MERNIRKGGIAAEAFYWAQALVYALVVLVLINVFLLRISVVDGSSMLPTLTGGDLVLVRVFGYSQPVRGDVIVVNDTGLLNEALVKRVIGLGGDVIDIDEVTGNVSVNGKVLVEPYINERIRDTYNNVEYPYTVSEGRVFVMGDNRNASTDSRASYVGALSCDQVVGKVLFRFWPLSEIGGIQ